MFSNVFPVKEFFAKLLSCTENSRNIKKDIEITWEEEREISHRHFKASFYIRLLNILTKYKFCKKYHFHSVSYSGVLVDLNLNGFIAFYFVLKYINLLVIVLHRYFILFFK